MPADGISRDRIRGASRLGVYPGTFDPLTRAHIAVAEAARDAGCDAVALVVPQRSVGKESRRHFDARAARVAEVIARRPGLAAATTSAGLYVDIALSAREAAPDAELSIVVGADKVPQIFDAGYYTEPLDIVLDRMFALADLLVAPRADFEIPADPRVRRLDIDARYLYVSASDVRHRLEHGQSVRHLLASAPPDRCD